MAENRDIRFRKKRPNSPSRIGGEKRRASSAAGFGGLVFVNSKPKESLSSPKKQRPRKRSTKEKVVLDRQYSRREAVKKAKDWKHRRFGPFAPASFLPSKAELRTRINRLRFQRHQGVPLSLDPHQVEGVNYLVESQNRLLFDDMGLGKTVQVLMALGEPSKCGVLVICPKSVQLNWVAETKKWRPDFYHVEAVDRKNFRWPRIGEVIIAKWHSLPEKGTQDPPPNPVHCVMDEAQVAKTPTTDISKNIRALRALCQAVWVLTGTPLMNKPRDLYQVMRLGGYNKIFGPAATFEETFFRFGKGGEAVEGYPETKEAFSHVRLRRMKNLVPGLPPKRFTEFFVSLKDNELRQKCSKAMAVFGGEDGIRKVIEKSIGAKRDGDREEHLQRIRRLIAIAKAPYVLERIQEFEDRREPLVVFCYHEEITSGFGDRPGWGKIVGGVSASRRNRIMNDFNKGLLKGVAMTTAGAVGINLQETCSHLIRVDLTFSPSINSQICDRVHRRGQKRRVTIEDVIANHPIDRIIHSILRRKERVLKSIDL